MDAVSPEGVQAAGQVALPQRMELRKEVLMMLELPSEPMHNMWIQELNYEMIGDNFRTLR
jgi:hypothetical protein